jgi:hypothetical protein
MHIELIGSTGAGKSTLASRVIEGCRGRGNPSVSGHDLVLRTVGLEWIRHRFVRTLMTDVVAAVACLLTLRAHAPFFRFAVRTIASLPGSRLRRLNTARNVFKNVGIWIIARRASARGQTVVVDEGTLQTAHYLFVHVSVDVDRDGIETFARLVPLPDVAVYVRQDEAVLVGRTLERGHRRVPDRLPAHVRLFIGRAAETFQLLAQQPRVQARLVVLDPDQAPSLGGDEVNGAPAARMPADDGLPPRKDGARWATG